MLNNKPLPDKFYKTAVIVFATAAISTLAQNLIQWGFEHFKKKVSKVEDKTEEKKQ